ncbi:MAG: hypothetical protein U1F35_04395 [Steroidobacteraceae bacterium]
MSDENTARDEISLAHVAIGAGAIAAAIALSLLAAWRMIVGFGGTLHDPAVQLPEFPPPALQRQPLSDRRDYEAREARKRP